MRPLRPLVIPVVSLTFALGCGGSFTSDDRSDDNIENDAGTGASTGSGGENAGTGGRRGAGGATSASGGATAGMGGAVVCCGAVPTCGANEIEVPPGAQCPPGYNCHSVTMCCDTIQCGTPIGQCEAYPSCDPGDLEISGACPPDRICYTRSLCGTTINCSPPGGVQDAGPPVCDAIYEPYRKYVSHDPQECALIDYLCVSGSTHFSNGCGCGCEQPPWCPETAYCTQVIPAFILPPPGVGGAAGVGGGGAGVPAPPLPDPCTDPTVCPFTTRL